jgi:hypothetical protein
VLTEKDQELCGNAYPCSYGYLSCHRKKGHDGPCLLRIPAKKFFWMVVYVKFRPKKFMKSIIWKAKVLLRLKYE